jgi:glycosyltransferase involved in cell wall biosynthesis
MDDFEHIIIDAGSTDGSREYLKSLNFRNVRLIFEGDSGPADGLNKGLSLLSGEIFMYLNSDDELDVGALENVSRLHYEFKEDVILGDGWIIDSNSQKIKKVYSDSFTPIIYYLGGIVLQQSSSFKTSLIDRGLRFNVENRVSWDGEFHFDAFALGATFRNVQESIGLFRIYPETITSSRGYLRKLEAESARILLSKFPKPVVHLRRIPRLVFRVLKKIKNILKFWPGERESNTINLGRSSKL